MISSRAVLISSSLRPSRPACHPGLSSRFVVSPGLPVPSPRSACRVSARSCSIGSSGSSGSSRHLILLSCRFYRYPVGACPIHGGGLAAGMVGNGDGGGAFLYAPFSSAHYRSHCHRVLIIGAVSTDGIVSSSHHLIISSVRLISLVPRCPIISSRSGGVGACHLSSKQRQHGGLLGSSSHPIPVMGRLVSCVSSSVSHDTPGTSTSRRGGRSKQTNTQKR